MHRHSTSTSQGLPPLLATPDFSTIRRHRHTAGLRHGNKGGLLLGDRLYHTKRVSKVHILQDACEPRSSCHRSTVMAWEGIISIGSGLQELFGAGDTDSRPRLQRRSKLPSSRPFPSGSWHPPIDGAYLRGTSMATEANMLEPNGDLASTISERKSLCQRYLAMGLHISIYAVILA